MKIELTNETWALLEKVQYDTNCNTAYKSDDSNYKVSEHWVGDIGLKQGDCEDIALKKMLILIEKGLPEDCMGIGTCFVQGDRNRGHAVLIVSTDKGDYVLDNRFERVYAWNDLPEYYEWNYVPPNVRE